MAENLLPQSQQDTFIELIEDIVKQLRLNPEHSLPLVAHGPPDQSASGSPVTSRRPREREQNVDLHKVMHILKFYLSQTITNLLFSFIFFLSVFQNFSLYF